MANFGDDHVVLLEETVQANKDAITENKKLRDELKARDEEHRKVLGEVLKELQNLKDSSQRLPKRRSRSRKVQVPPGCRRTLRKVYKTLLEKDDFQGFFLEESCDSANNKIIQRRLLEEVYHYVGGEDNCQWSAEQVEEAFKRYFLSTFETERKKQSGKYNEHKRKCRKQGRKKEKLVRRTIALDKSKWNKKRKGEMAEVLTEAYMSSEDSEYDESGKVLNYNVKDLAWESPKLKKRKKLLDKLHNKSQSQRSQNRLVKRVRDKTLSIHPKPDDCPTWACDDNYTTVG